MGVDKNSSRRRLKLQQDELAQSDPQNHTLRTSTFHLPNHVATGVLLVLGTNTTSNLDTHTPTTAETTRKPAIQRGAVRQGMGAVRSPPSGKQEILRNTSSEHQNAQWFHQQKSLVRAMLATRISCQKPKLHPRA
jgi:hypothetical protein